MFTDIVGYSQIASTDEAGALRILESHRARVRPLFLQHGGREIKSMADGFLVEFGSAVEAARCALAIQEQNSDPKIRIGIHLGDVVADGDDLLGDGVNIASRIEQLATPGGICVSEDVARQIRNKVPVALESIGMPQLKNISTRLEVFRLNPQESAPESGPRASNSIAVLPFANLSPEPENEYFSDGLTEDILTQLSRISSLRVISRTSVMQYKGTTKSIREIGRELGVHNVLEGSVRKAGNRVRISAQLIDAGDDEHLWAQNYDRELNDIFAVQTDVAEQIAQALKAHISPNEEARIKQVPTESVDAYQDYLRGRYFLGQRSAASLQRALEYFAACTSVDPQYALAYTGEADTYIVISLLELAPPREAFPKAKSAAEHALHIEPDLAQAHASLGLVKFQYDWDWGGAEQELLTAIRLNPNYAPAHHFYADTLKALGRFDEALTQIKEAQALDPLSLAVNSGVGHVYYLSRNYDAAIQAYRETVDLDPNFVQARLWFGRPYLQKGMFSEAIRELETAVNLSGRSTISLAVLAHAYASAGRTDAALEILNQLSERAKTQYVPSYWIGLIYVGLGENGEALDFLERAIEERSSWLPWINVEPRFDSLRDEPRFKRLVVRMGFPQT